MACVVRRRRGGQTTIEYTLLLALVVGSLFGVWNLVGVSHAKSFGTLNDQLASGTLRNPHRAAVVDDESETEAEPFSRIAMVWAIPLGLAALAIYSQTRSLRGRDAARGERRGERSAEMADYPGHSRLFEKRQQIFKLIERDFYAMLEGRLQVRQLMSTELATVLDTASLDEVKAVMVRNELRHMLVCDHHGKLCGIISNRDFNVTKGKLARDVMVRDPVTVNADSLVSPAATVLIDRRISALPVVDHGKLCGMLTTTDLVMALQCSLQVMLKQSVGGGTRATDRC